MRFSFRAWHEDANQMIPRCDQGFEGDVFNWLKEGQPVVIMQGIGLKDKAGVEIFEGDIVECRMTYEDGTLPHAGIIVWMDSFGAFATKNHSGETLLHNHLLNTFKVIGNIYENPKWLDQAA